MRVPFIMSFTHTTVRRVLATTSQRRNAKTRINVGMNMKNLYHLVPFNLNFAKVLEKFCPRFIVFAESCSGQSQFSTFCSVPRGPGEIWINLFF